MKVRMFISSRTGTPETDLLMRYIRNFNKRYRDWLKDYGISEVVPIHIGPQSGMTTTDVRERVTKEIESADIFLLVLTSNREKNDEWIMFESGYAIAKKKRMSVVTFNQVNSVPGPLENIHRIIVRSDRDFNENLKKEIENGLKDRSFIRGVLLNNYCRNIIRYFPLDEAFGLRCGISQTSLNVEPYFLEPVGCSFDKGVRFNGNFYLRQFVSDFREVPDSFSVCFWFKIEEEGFKKKRFCKDYPERDEPIFFFTIGSMRKETNSHVGVYYGRPSTKESKGLGVGMRIFTYCGPKEQGKLEFCDSKDYFEEIEAYKWYFAVLVYSPGNRIKLYLYSQDSKVGPVKIIQTEESSDGIAVRSYLTIGGGFPFNKMFVVVGEKGWKAISHEEKERILEDIKRGKYYTNSSLHLIRKIERCRTDEYGQLLPEERLRLRPYALPLIDDFRFIGKIREFLILDKVLSNDIEGINDLWKLTRNLVQE